MEAISMNSNNEMENLIANLEQIIFELEKELLEIDNYLEQKECVLWKTY